MKSFFRKDFTPPESLTLILAELISLKWEMVYWHFDKKESTYIMKFCSGYNFIMVEVITQSRYFNLYYPTGFNTIESDIEKIKKLSQ